MSEKALFKIALDKAMAQCSAGNSVVTIYAISWLYGALKIMIARRFSEF